MNIPLETTDEFITHGLVKAIGKEYIVITNRGRDGDILLFDRNGKGIRKINHFGQGGEEYVQNTAIVLDEENKELFVVDYTGRKILVYDLTGEFKRVFAFADTSYYNEVFGYDRNHLICYKAYPPAMESEESRYIIVSKKDGSIVREIEIPFKELETPMIIQGEMVVAFDVKYLISHGNGWALAKPSADTLYNYTSKGEQTPLIARTPPINSMDVKAFLFPQFFTNRYYFMKILKKEFDVERMIGTPMVNIAYDMQDHSTFRHKLYNADYSNKKSVSLRPAVNGGILSYEVLEASKLLEDNEKGLLTGRLKEVADTLDDEANPVIMVVKEKK